MVRILLCQSNAVIKYKFLKYEICRFQHRAPWPSSGHKQGNKFKNTLPILDCFFNLSDNELEITASDLESTLITRIKLENTEGDG